MTKRMERLLVTSNFLTFAVVVALWIRMDVKSGLEDRRFSQLEEELQDSNKKAAQAAANLGGGLFPEGWQFSPGGLARNYPAPTDIKLPTWDEPARTETHRETRPLASSQIPDTTIRKGESADDIWYRGYMLNKFAEENEEQGILVEALKFYNAAEIFFHHVSEHFPEFHTEIVRKRINLLKTKRIALKSKISPSQPETERSKTGSQMVIRNQNEIVIPEQGPKDEPADTWYRAFMKSKAAEELELKGELASALNEYKQAESLLRELDQTFPEYHGLIVIDRLKLVIAEQNRIRVRLENKKQTVE